LLEALRAEIDLPGLRIEVRGRGLMAGLEIKNDGGLAMRAVKEMLRRGFILLPEGARGNVISFTPPLTISRRDLARTVGALKESLA
jgi:4-aminobutyrate aminotransferase/(S)-3-amino-2-methylpropionate transaminase